MRVGRLAAHMVAIEDIVAEYGIIRDIMSIQSLEHS